MTRPRTIFAPFALIALFGVLLAVARVGDVSTAPREAEFTKGSRRAGEAPRLGLIIPVVGLAVSQLDDTWGEARSEGRSHEGIDLMAARGTEVIAAADGRIVKFFDSVRGGTTIYQFDASERFVYYYAHLDARARGLSEGAHVRQGDVIGYVGMTGNAPLPHLHFEIQRLTAARRWWEAESLNPYPLLVSGRAPA
ncbi:peptidase of M23/M37 family [alpha proteobacterium U9-1i]|nr:peptidase of M23/M37 family [alpha proteobacterium U9-1i]